MFVDTYEHTIDEKGRIILPSKHRKILDKYKSREVVILKGLDNCIYIYPFEKWNEFITQEIKKFSNLKSKTRLLQRKLAANAKYRNVDKNGRLHIPQDLKEEVNIKDKVMVVGVIDRIELWDKDEWEKYNKRTKSIEKIAEEIF